MAGFMLTTMFLSMWISNTATTAMMVPIVDAILAELYAGQSDEEETGTEIADLSIHLPHQSQMDLVPAEDTQNSHSTYSEPTGINFLSWMLFNVPVMLLCMFLAWLWLQLYFSGRLCGQRKLIRNPSAEREKAVKQLILSKYQDLGRITFQEIVVLTLFIILVLLWLFRAPEFIPGWSKLFDDKFGVDVHAATPVMLIVFLLFALPAKLDFWCFRKPGDPEPERVNNNSCLSWKVVQEKIPWGVVLLLGGGFAMAEGAKKSGLSEWLGESLRYIKNFDGVYIVIIVTFSTAMLTEVASNTATASILLPVLNELAINIQVNPIYLMLPATVCCSYAFMLPVATPPNAIVLGAANMRTTQMVYSGIVMNIICIIVINVMINTLGVYMFDLKNVPLWVNSTIPHSTQ